MAENVLAWNWLGRGEDAVRDSFPRPALNGLSCNSGFSFRVRPARSVEPLTRGTSWTNLGTALRPTRTMDMAWFATGDLAVAAHGPCERRRYPLVHADAFMFGAMHHVAMKTARHLYDNLAAVVSHRPGNLQPVFDPPLHPVTHGVT